MPTRKPSRPSRRTTMPLTGSVRHAGVRLSFQAVAATRLTVQMLAHCSPLRPTQSAVARQALLEYARKVELMSPAEREREARYVLSASKARIPDDLEAMERTLAGLEASGEGNPLPSLAEVLHGPSTGFDPAALEDKVNAMLKAAHPRRFAHL